ncbi:MAG: hypothetical protein HYZ29_08730 [Myxococcales bacterium]|nr:hypothetical protein [Myxococcales bacterium]
MADMRTLYVEIPASLHRQLRVRAAEQERLLRDVVATALAAYLDAPGTSPQGKVRQPDPLKEPTEPNRPRNPKPPHQPPATTGPGSRGYVAPVRPADVEPDDEVGELPVATDDENPFEGMTDLLREES